MLTQLVSKPYQIVFLILPKLSLSLNLTTLSLILKLTKLSFFIYPSCVSDVSIESGAQPPLRCCFKRCPLLIAGSDKLELQNTEELAARAQKWQRVLREALRTYAWVRAHSKGIKTHGHLWKRMGKETERGGDDTHVVATHSSSLLQGLAPFGACLDDEPQKPHTHQHVNTGTQTIHTLSLTSEARPEKAVPH